MASLSLSLSASVGGLDTHPIKSTASHFDLSFVWY